MADARRIERTKPTRKLGSQPCEPKVCRLAPHEKLRTLVASKLMSPPGICFPESRPKDTRKSRSAFESTPPPIAPKTTLVAAIRAFSPLLTGHYTY
jgi:hypothetical protein